MLAISPGFTICFDGCFTSYNVDVVSLRVWWTYPKRTYFCWGEDSHTKLDISEIRAYGSSGTGHKAFTLEPSRCSDWSLSLHFFARPGPSRGSATRLNLTLASFANGTRTWPWAMQMVSRWLGGGFGVNFGWLSPIQWYNIFVWPAILWAMFSCDYLIVCSLLV